MSVVTNVDLDHMDRLGDTIAKIAREKAAIIERGDLAVTGARGDGLAVIRGARGGWPCRSPRRTRPAPSAGTGTASTSTCRASAGPGSAFVAGTRRPTPSIADATLDALEAAGIATVPDEARRRGYADAVWPGRLELVRAGDRDVLLDGAHNPAGAAALAVALDDLWPYLSPGPPAPLSLVTASMADKDVDGVIDALMGSGALAGATILCTSLDVPRAMPAAELAAHWRARYAGPVSDEPDPLAALDRALGDDRGGPLVVAGSLYLVGAARGHLVDDPDLRDPEPDLVP